MSAPILSDDTRKACLALIAMAQKQAATIADPDDAAREMQSIAAAQAQMGDIAAALATLKKMPANPKPELGLVSYNLSGSLFALEALAARYPKNDSLRSSLAEAEARAGRFTEALTEFAKLKATVYHEMVLHVILFEAALRGNTKVANDMLALLKADLPKDASAGKLAEFAQRQALCGHLEAALETADAIHDERIQADCKTGIAGTMAMLGDFAKAESLADQLPYPPRDMAFMQISETLAELGRFSEARAFLPRFGDLDSRIEALHHIGIEQAKVGQIDAALAILADVGGRPNLPSGILRLELVKALIKK